MDKQALDEEFASAEKQSELNLLVSNSDASLVATTSKVHERRLRHGRSIDSQLCQVPAGESDKEKELEKMLEVANARNEELAARLKSIESIYRKELRVSRHHIQDLTANHEVLWGFFVVLRRLLYEKYSCFSSVL